MADTPGAKARSNRWQIIGLSLGVLTTFAAITEVDGVWRYVYLLLGGAVGALLGRIAARLIGPKPPSAG